MELSNSIRSRRQETYNKLKERFASSVQNRSFQKKRKRERIHIIEKLQKLEKQLGIRTSKHMKHWAAALGLGVITTTASAQDFTPGPYLGDTQISEEIIEADFDDDGDLDLMTFSYYGSIKIIENDGTGAFTTIHEIYEVTGVEGIGAADVDEDGDIDIILADDNPASDYDTYLRILKNDGGFSFSVSSNTLTDVDVDDPLVFGDVDGDGDIDLFFNSDVNGSGSYLQIYLNDSTGLFSGFGTISSNYDRFVIDDFDEDGDLDIVIHNYSSLNLFLGDNTGYFADTAAVQTPLSGGLDEFVNGDMDDDGDIDLVYSDSEHLVIMNNDSTGSFFADTVISKPSNNWEFDGLQLVDIDTDGDLDILTIEEFDSTGVRYESTLILLQTTPGEFQVNNRDVTTSFGDTDRVRGMDVDGDTDIDLVATNYFDIVVHKNDGSENFTVFDDDILEVVYGFGAELVDIDGDDDLDVLNTGVSMVLENDGSGGLTVSQNLAKDYNLITGRVIAADFDNDGDFDAVFAAYDYVGAGGPILWENTGGLFTPIDTLVTDSVDYVIDMQAVDWDEDGDIDLIVVGEEYSSNNGLLLRFDNSGPGTLTLSEFDSPGFEIEQILDTMDVDQDGDLDLVIGGEYGVYLAENFNDTIYFTATLFDPSPGDFEHEFGAVGDIDGDGDRDIILINEQAFEYGDKYHYKLINNGPSDFIVDSLSISTQAYGGILIEDFDLDGDNDIFLGGGEETPDEFWENDGTGTFTLVGTQTSVSYNPTAGDIDGDGDLDIFSNQYYTASRLIINEAISPAADTIAPVVDIDPVVTNDQTPDITGSIDDNTATIALEIDAVDYPADNNGDGTWTIQPDTLATLSEGYHDVRVIAADLDSNMFDSTFVNAILIDLTPPVASFDTLTALIASPELTGTIDDSLATVTVTVNDSTYAGVVTDTSWSVTSTEPLSNGTYDVIVNAVDIAGNAAADTTFNGLTINVDDVAPVVTFDTLTSTSPTPELTGTIDDESATLTVTVNDSTYTGITITGTDWSLVTTEPLLNGLYDVALYAEDSLGNSVADTTFNGLTINAVLPTVTVDPLSTNDNTPALSGTVTNGASVEVFVDDSTYTATITGGTWDLAETALLADGTYDVMVSVTDSVGNIALDGTTNELRIDATAPVVGFDTLITSDVTPTLTGTVDDSTATVSVMVGDSTYTGLVVGTTWSADITDSLTYSTYDVTVMAEDSVTNTVSNTFTDVLTVEFVDTEAPVVGFTPLSTSNDSPTLTGTINDTTATLTITVDGDDEAAVIAGDGTWSAGPFSFLSTGSYDVQAVATDSSANVTDTTFTAGLIIFEDTIPPVVTFEPFETLEPSPGFGGTIDDVDVFSFTIIVNGQSLTPVVSADSTWTVAAGELDSLAPNGYDVLITALDASFNQFDSTYINGITITQLDSIAPIVTVDPKVTSNPTPSISGTVSESDVTMTVTVNDSTYSDIFILGAIWSLTETAPLPVGTYDVEVTATDLSGNVGMDVTTDELVILSDGVGLALDSAALVQIYESTGGTNWTNKSGWLTGPIAIWNGVTVTAGRVSALDLSNKNMRGTFPQITSGLDALENLDISFNELTDVKIDASLTELQNVDISQNRLVFDVISALTGSYDITNTAQKEVLKSARGLGQIGSSITVDRTVPGGETYTWFRDGEAYAADGPSFSVEVTSFEDEAAFHAEVTSSSVPGLTLTTTPFNLRVSSLERDSTALEAIRAAVGPGTLGDWSGPVTGWSEVTVTDERVVGIDFSNKELAGVLPEDILDIGGLATVNLSGNALTSIPELSSLSGLTSFDISANALDFGSIEPNFEITGINFANQAKIGMYLEDTIAKGADRLIEIATEGSALNYQWTYKGDPISGATQSSYLIQDIAYETMGEYAVNVTSDIATEITLTGEDQKILAYGNIEFSPAFFFADSTKGFVGQGQSKLFLITESGPYLLTDSAEIENQTIFHERVVLGDYLLNVRTEPNYRIILPGVDTVQFIPTYYESVIEWDSADVLELREFISDELRMQRIPPPLSEEDEGVIKLLVESDFEEEEDARIEARRRVKKAGCSLRRRTRGGGGRTEEDEWALVAYAETDDNGEVNFGNLPDGDYRLNIQYPGIPMDPNSFVEFTISQEDKVEGWSLEATVTEDGIEVVGRIITGTYEGFKDLLIYPNPADEQIQIQYARLLKDDVKVNLMNLSGQLIHTQHVSKGLRQQFTLDTSELEDGIYLLHFYNSSDHSSPMAAFRVIVKH